MKNIILAILFIIFVITVFCAGLFMCVKEVKHIFFSENNITNHIQASQNSVK